MLDVGRLASRKDAAFAILYIHEVTLMNRSRMFWALAAVGCLVAAPVVLALRFSNPYIVALRSVGTLLLVLIASLLAAIAVMAFRERRRAALLCCYRPRASRAQRLDGLVLRFCCFRRSGDACIARLPVPTSGAGKLAGRFIVTSTPN